MGSVPIFPVLVAHRGYPLRFPENTLEGIIAALDAGACFVEFDIQLSADGVPVVIHDQNLERTAGADLCVLDKKVSELKNISVGEPSRFGNKYRHARIPTLDEMVALLQQWSHVVAFAELKRASLCRFGQASVLKPVLDSLSPILNRCTVISFDKEAVAEIKKVGKCGVGWVIDAYNDEVHGIASDLKPDFLFCNTKRIPPSPQSLWRGPWRWVIYEINDPKIMCDLAARGIEFIETGEIGEMLQYPALKEQAGKQI